MTENILNTVYDIIKNDNKIKIEQRELLETLNQLRDLYQSEVINLNTQNKKYDYYIGKASGLQLIIDFISNVDITF